MDSYAVDEPGFWRPATIAAGIILLLVLFAGAFVIIVEQGGGSNTHPGAQQPTPGSVQTGGGTPSSATPPTTAGTGTHCSLPAGDQTVPQATPQGITWQIYQTVALPFSKTYGPQVIDGDIARCYAHDPLGALLAATQLSIRVVASPSTDVAREQVVPGPGQTAFISQDVQTPGGNTPGTFAQIAGFKFVTYSPATAVIEIATRETNGNYQAGAVTVEWMNGDWKLLLQPTGGTSPNVLPLSSLVGFSTWAGV
ncbi:MAG: hypothetical protein M3Y91_14660 [Actinomycetota bacterium]|nr:hypothetical protein [Actinomycetota bacterium]